MVCKSLVALSQSDCRILESAIFKVGVDQSN